MKTARNAFITVFAVLALGACQRRGTIGMEAYQSELSDVVAKYTQTISSTFGSRGISSRGAVSSSSNPLVCPAILYAPGYGSNSGCWQSAVPQYTQPAYPAPTCTTSNCMGYADAAQQCLQAVQALPKTQAAYQTSIITLARCLNRLMQEQNYMMTWMFQQMPPQTQQQWTYNMSYPVFAQYGNGAAYTGNYGSQYYDPNYGSAYMQTPYYGLGYNGVVTY